LRDKFAAVGTIVVCSVHLKKRECKENDSHHSAIVLHQSTADLRDSMVVGNEESIAVGQINRSY
jgi:hypothetical protein